MSEPVNLEDVIINQGDRIAELEKQLAEQQNKSQDLWLKNMTLTTEVDQLKAELESVQSVLEETTENWRLSMEYADRLKAELTGMIRESARIASERETFRQELEAKK